MSRGMRLSVLGLYQYDSGLFSEMVYPAGFSSDEKQTVVGNILAECAELECLFADAATMKTMIGLWSKLNISVWERIFTASKLEYNPIENYNRTELETISDDRTDTHSGQDISQASGSDTTQASGSDSQNISNTHTETNSGTDTSTNSIQAYDSNIYQPHDKSELQHGHSVTESDTGSVATTFGKKDTITHGKKDTFTHGEKIVHEGDITRENHTSGNIGVTTSQQMLEQEIEVSAKLNIIKMIVESFKERFCLLVY